MSRLEDLLERLQGTRFAAPNDQDTETNAPFLWEFLSTSLRNDGTPRIPPIIKIERVPGAYLATLQDDEFMVKKSVQIQRLSDLVPALEAALGTMEGFVHMQKSFRNKKPRIEAPAREQPNGRKKKR